jgi:hypothetical protein
LPCTWFFSLRHNMASTRLDQSCTHKNIIIIDLLSLCYVCNNLHGQVDITCSLWSKISWLTKGLMHLFVLWMHFFNNVNGVGPHGNSWATNFGSHHYHCVEKCWWLYISYWCMCHSSTNTLLLVL